MKDHSFYLAMSYAAPVVVVVIEAFRLQQQRRLALRTRALERAAAPQDDGTGASTQSLPGHAPAFNEALEAVQEAHPPQGHQPAFGRSQPAADAGLTRADRL